MGIEIIEIGKVKCKHCGSEAIVKYGSYKGLPRYWCKVCKKKFKADDNLSGMRMPATQIADALNPYYDGTSVGAMGDTSSKKKGIPLLLPPSTTGFKNIASTLPIALKTTVQMSETNG
jgi:DNA-directed RNA polymerase subunit RPC12/RpoP